MRESNSTFSTRSLVYNTYFAFVSKDSCNIEDIFAENLMKEQSENSIEDLERSRALRDFVQNIWDVHHSDGQLSDDNGRHEDADVHIEKITGDKLLCPFTKVIFIN